MGTKLLQRLSVIGFLGLLTLSALAGVFLAEVTLHPGRHVQSHGNEVQANEMARLHNSELLDRSRSMRRTESLSAPGVFVHTMATETL